MATSNENALSSIDNIINDVVASTIKRKKTDDSTGLSKKIRSAGSTSKAGPKVAVKRKAVDPNPGPKPKRVYRKVPCPTCGKEIDVRYLAQHKRIHSEFCYDCRFCNYKNCKDLDYMRHHYRTQHPDANHKCKECGWQFASEDAFFDTDHLEMCIKQVAHECPQLEPLPVEVGQLQFVKDPHTAPNTTSPFWQDPVISPYALDQAVVAKINQRWGFFRQNFKTNSNLVHEYAFRTTGLDTASFTIPNALKFIYKNVDACFNFNVGVTTLLKKENQGGPNEYEIFVAQNNRQNLFNRNILVHNIASLEEAIKQVNDIGDLTERVERPESSWQVVAVLGVTFYCYIRLNYVAGRGESRLPKYLTGNSSSILNFERDLANHLITDNLCLFRCLIAAMKGDPYKLDDVLRPYELYRQRVNGSTWNQFEGVPEEHIPLIEQLCNIQLQIFRKSADKTVKCLRKATDDMRPIVNVHSHPIDARNVHFSLITNLNNFAGRHMCVNCGKMFKQNDRLVQHQSGNRCHSGETAHTYKDACYEPTKTIFDQMSEFGIFVEHDRRRSDGYIVWDMESCLEPIQLNYQRSEQDEATEMRLNRQNIQVEYVDNAAKLQLREYHKPVTGSIKSSVSGFTEDQFFYNEDPDSLLKDIFAAMIEISDRNYALQLESFATEFEKLDECLKKAEAVFENASDSEKRQAKFNLKKIKRLINNFNRYLRSCTVLTLNGGRYDLNICKAHLFPQMTERVRAARNDSDNDGQDGSCSWPKAISRGSAIFCLTTDELRFLDVTQYAPGTSLAAFIKAFNPNGDGKGVLPYEILKSYSDLFNVTEFPPKSAFYSTLKGKGIDDQEYADAKAIWDSLPEPRTLLDYVRWYNNRDVSPFLVACQNMHQLFWRNFNIDIFKQAQSIPGVCLAYLFQRLNELSPTTRFGLFGNDQADLCQEFYSSMTGGTFLLNKFMLTSIHVIQLLKFEFSRELSYVVRVHATIKIELINLGLATIVTRFAEVGKTKIRGGENVVKNIVGLDFNALYLESMCLYDMPTGYADHFVCDKDGVTFTRKSESFEEKLKRRKAHGEVHYLKFAAYRDNVYIHHNEHGQQTRLGTNQWRVDGYAKDAQPRPRVYEYNGCKYHNHKDRCLNINVESTPTNEKQVLLDEAKEKELRDLGFDYVVTWECRFKRLQAIAKALRKGGSMVGVDPESVNEAGVYNEFLQKHPLRKFNNRKEVNYQEMFAALMKGQAFGFAKVDLKTKDHLRDAYSDFPPVIKNAEVSKDDIGEYMKSVAEELGQMDKPRRCLINSYTAEAQWIMTPMLQWYHSHGVEITRIYEVCMYDREKTFDWFSETVTEHRKRGDVDKSQALLGMIFKLLGNSAYGKTLTQLSKHMDTSYVDAAEMRKVHNSPYHHRTIEITPNCFEVHKRKEKIEFNLPLQIGLSVYSYAKLKVLRFIYDVLQVYLPRESYEFLESDTDSIYLALFGKTFKDCVPKEKLAAFELIEKDWFVIDDTQLRTPGLLKVEVEGKAFVGLSPKCYFVLKHNDDPKFFCKGVQYRNQEILTYVNFCNVLNNAGGETNAINIGIRPLKNKVFTYVQSKTGLSPLLIKRVCNADNFMTAPLLI